MSGPFLARGRFLSCCTHNLSKLTCSTENRLVDQIWAGHDYSGRGRRQVHQHQRAKLTHSSCTNKLLLLLRLAAPDQHRKRSGSIIIIQLLLPRIQLQQQDETQRQTHTFKHKERSVNVPPKKLLPGCCFNWNISQNLSGWLGSLDEFLFLTV